MDKCSECFRVFTRRYLDKDDKKKKVKTEKYARLSFDSDSSGVQVTNCFFDTGTS